MKVLSHSRLIIIPISQLMLVAGVACNEPTFQGAALRGAQITEGADATTNTMEKAIPSNKQPIAEVSTDLDPIKSPDLLLASFPTSTLEDASFKFNLAPTGVSTEFMLEDIISNRTDRFTQITRSPVSQVFKQGTSGQTLTETFGQNVRKGLVDILVVIDNSGSMVEEQVNLSSKMNELLVSIKDASWQISVITTSPVISNSLTADDPASEGQEKCVTTLIKKGEVDAMEKFALAVNAGLKGNGNEQGIRQAVVGLRCKEQPWLRPNSTLAVLIVSDEDNCSTDGSGCGTLPWGKETYLTDYVEKTLGRTVGKNAGLFGIVSPSIALCPTGGNVGTQYMRLFAYKSVATNYGNICEGSYTPTLNKISDSISLLLDTQFELNDIPDANSLNLSQKLLNGTISTVDKARYSQTGKVIAFVSGSEPPAGSSVTATYIVGAKPILKSFALSQVPAPMTLVVKVNGIIAPLSQYTLSGQTINFASAPADLADIIIDYRQNVPLLDRFKPTATPLTNSLSANINGTATAGFIFDAPKGEVVLAKAPLDGETIDLTYKYREGPRLSYALPITKDGANFTIFDQSKAPISFAQVANVFTITAAQHQVGKKLTLSYTVPESGIKQFGLGHTPVKGSLMITGGSDQCDLGMGLEINGEELLASCRLDQAMDFSLAYKYMKILNSFELKGVKDPAKGSWKVFVDGEETTAYTRSASTITLDFEPTPESKVQIQYSTPE